MKGYSSTYCFIRIVIPAQAGIQSSIQHRNPTWIPAFAGMTDSGGCFVPIASRVFSKEDTKSTKFKNIEFKDLRVLRAFVVNTVFHFLMRPYRTGLSLRI